MTTLWIQVIHYPIVNAFLRLKLHVVAYSCTASIMQLSQKRHITVTCKFFSKKT